MTIRQALIEADNRLGLLPASQIEEALAKAEAETHCPKLDFEIPPIYTESVIKMMMRCSLAPTKQRAQADKVLGDYLATLIWPHSN